MNRNFGAFAAVLLTCCLAAYACTSGEVVDGPITGTGGSGNTVGGAGTTGSGNTVGNAGTMGQAGRGGTTGTAGNTVGAAGTTGRGGTTGTGNTVGGAGTTGTGNTQGGAGTTGTGNVAGGAGTTGSGGNGSVTCSGTFETSADGFVRAPAARGACWHGYSFAGGDAGSTITPKDFSACGTPCMLKMSGTVGPATMANNYVGVSYLGFNLGQDSGSMTKGTVTPTGTGVTVTFAASTGSLPLRAQLSSGSIFWCFTITGSSPAQIPYTMFNNTCWAPTTAGAYAKQPIDNFELVVPGADGPATPNVSVTLTSVKEY